MRWERIDEAAKVRADFQGGTVSPVLIRRGDQVIRVREVNTRWQEPRGRYRRCYFSVTADTGDAYQLWFDTGDLLWRLDAVLFEG